jgi:hypothetical protein
MKARADLTSPRDWMTAPLGPQHDVQNSNGHDPRAWSSEKSREHQPGLAAFYRDRVPKHKAPLEG